MIFNFVILRIFQRRSFSGEPWLCVQLNADLKFEFLEYTVINNAEETFGLNRDTLYYK